MSRFIYDFHNAVALYQDDSRNPDSFTDEEIPNDDDNDDVEATVNELIANRRGSSRKSSVGSGINTLPPRPDNPTPPKKLPRRPASATGQRFIPADAGKTLNSLEKA